MAERREGVVAELGEGVVVGKGEGMMVGMGEGVVVEVVVVGMWEGVVVGRKGVQASGLSDGADTGSATLESVEEAVAVVEGGSRGRLRACVERLGVPEAMQSSSMGTSAWAAH